MADKIKVLVIDDSPTTRYMMVQLINQTADMQVVGEGIDGAEAVELTTQYKPDVVLMDVVMPQMDGLKATGQIMHTRPTPIVLVSAGLGSSETDVAFKAMKAGALTVLRKPAMAEHSSEITELLGTVRAMAGVSVIHHRDTSQPIQPLRPATSDDSKPSIVAIAASTGGPAALSEIIWNLPSDFALPIVVVQHITAAFVPSLVGWLNHVSKLPVQIAKHGAPVMPGVIHVAPGEGHLSISSQHRFIVNPQRMDTRFMPSGDILLRSVAQTYGKRAIGIVLTGMGDDGARGLQAMYSAGALTIAQDQFTSVVFGMPAEAIRLGAACHVLPLSKIAPILVHLAH